MVSAFAVMAIVLVPAADVSASSVETPAVPEELACLARHYALTPVWEDGAWSAVLPSGARLSFDDGTKKSFEQRLDEPDLKDIFLIPYRTGSIRPVEVENDDPGRVRVEALFAATYGGPAQAAASQVRVRFLGLPIRVHRKIAPALAQVEARLRRARDTEPGLARFLRRLSGGYAARKIAGTERTSAHAFGIAVDLDKSESDYWRWQKSKPLRWRNRFPQTIVDVFEEAGFIWGGRWYHYDTMHFEYRPELFGPPCREPLSAPLDTPSR